MNWGMLTPLLEMVKWVGIISAVGFWTMRVIDFLLSDPKSKGERNE